MAFVVKVWVQMPDGSFQHRPVARQRDNGMQVLKEDTFEEARDWAKYILPDRVFVSEEK